MTIDYIKLSPTQNVTVLVKNPVPRALQPRVAARLLEAVGGEQAGYLEAARDPRAAMRLQMMGGEFCGNATMALSAVLARDAGLCDGAALDLLLEVSGSDELVPCRIVREGGCWTGTVRMPLPTQIGSAQLETDAGARTFPLVRLPGIVHLILSADIRPGEDELRRRLPAWAGDLGADALGALTWDPDAAFLDPLVCVPSAGTLVRESGCGSGSAAIASWLAEQVGSGLKVGVRQPGGTIDVDVAMAGGRITDIRITGRVALMAEGSVQIDI